MLHVVWSFLLPYSPNRSTVNEMLNTDSHWRQWGKRDPYFAVLTDPDFRNSNLDKSASAKERFFATGDQHVASVLERCRAIFGSEFKPSSVLDFGCGVGRCTIPFARAAERVCGIDVSDDMLAEAKANCQRFSLSNTTFCNVLMGLDNIDERFDLLHSYIVFQHIPPRRGLKLFQQLTSLLNDGGVGVVHFTFGKKFLPRTFGYPPRSYHSLVQLLSLGYHQSKRLLGKKPDPEMQMNSYNLSQLCYILQNLGVQSTQFDFTDHGGALGAMLYFRK